MAKCPRCGTEVEKPKNEWDIKGSSNNITHVKHFSCPKCLNAFRTGERV